MRWLDMIVLPNLVISIIVTSDINYISIESLTHVKVNERHDAEINHLKRELRTMHYCPVAANTLG
jgi:hypothetical protein